jgi:hypothetical protein
MSDRTQPVPSGPTARELLETFRLSAADVELYVDRALSPGYWRTLRPDLQLGGAPAEDLALAAPLDPVTLRETTARFPLEGYVRAPSLVPATAAARMRDGAVALAAAGWPPVFAFMYDEFWRVARIAPIAALLTDVLGARYRQTPYVWTHVVAGRRGATGWAPHVDNTAGDSRLTVWIPLSDATIETGCMSVIPKHLTPQGGASPWYRRPTLDMSEALALLHASRALPARAGSVLGWDAGLMHWGSARMADGDPRISISMEFVPASAAPAVLAETLPVASNELPSHAHRLRIIASAIALYHTSDPQTARYAGLADRLLEQVGPPPRAGSPE